MGRRLRGAGSPSAKKAAEPAPKKDAEPPIRGTMEITILFDLIDRIDAVHSRTGLPKGQIIEAALETHLAGVRVASVPDRLLRVLGYTPTPGKSEGTETAPDPAVESGEVAGNVTSSDTKGLVPEAGAEEGGSRPPAPKKLTPAELRSRIPQKPGRKAS